MALHAGAGMEWCALLLAGLTLVVPCDAQVAELPPSLSGSSGQLEARIDSLSRVGAHQEALDLLDRRLEQRPADYRAHVLAAQEALRLGYGAAVVDVPTAKRWLRRAIGDAGWALEVRPQDSEAAYLSLASLGQLGLLEGRLEQARLAAHVDSAARALLADDPRNAGAHNVLGRLYEEVASISWAERMLGRPWLGGDLLHRATWEAAERELRRAVELQPERNFNQVDLGRVLLKRGRLEEAREILEAALAVPLEFPEEEVARVEARRLLSRAEIRP